MIGCQFLYESLPSGLDRQLVCLPLVTYYRLCVAERQSVSRQTAIMGCQFLHESLVSFQYLALYVQYSILSHTMYQSFYVPNLFHPTTRFIEYIFIYILGIHACILDTFVRLHIFSCL